MNYEAEAAQLVVVTDFGDLHVTQDELDSSGAVFTTRGKPMNLEARMLLDLADAYCFDSWSGWNGY